MVIDEALFQSMQKKLSKRFPLIVEVYFEESEAIIAELKQAGPSADQATMTRAVHSLKSSSASLGAIQLSTLSAELEASYRKGDLTEWERDWSSLNALYEKTKEAIKTLTATA